MGQEARRQDGRWKRERKGAEKPCGKWRAWDLVWVLDVMKFRITRSGSTGPELKVRPSADALTLPISWSRITAVSFCPPHAADGQSRGIPSITVLCQYSTWINNQIGWFRKIAITYRSILAYRLHLHPWSELSVRVQPPYQQSAEEYMRPPWKSYLLIWVKWKLRKRKNELAFRKISLELVVLRGFK